MEITELRIGQVVYVNNDNDPYHGQMGMIIELRSSNVENVARIAIKGATENILVKVENLSNYDPSEAKPAADWMIELYPNHKISDPDGWDRENFLEQYHIVPLTREEFKEKLNMSTIVPKSNESERPLTAGAAKMIIKRQTEKEIDPELGWVYQGIRERAKVGKSMVHVALTRKQAERLVSLGFTVTTPAGTNIKDIMNKSKCTVKWM